MLSKIKANSVLFLLGLLTFEANAAFQNMPKNLSYIFSHGVGGDKDQVKFYQLHSMLPGACHSFNYKDAEKGYFNKNQCFLGQGADIDYLKDARDKLKDKDAVIHGVSRGASTIINYVGKHQPKDIKALVLESPFYSAEDILTERVQWLSLASKKFVFNYAIFPKFNFKAEHPKDYIASIDKDIPVLLICVENDAVVPCSSTIKLYEALKDAGHQKCHLLVFKSGAHANLAHSPIYKQFVHAFYAHYGLPHNAKLAEEGKDYFAKDSK